MLRLQLPQMHPLHLQRQMQHSQPQDMRHLTLSSRGGACGGRCRQLPRRLLATARVCLACCNTFCAAASCLAQHQALLQGLPASSRTCFRAALCLLHMREALQWHPAQWSVRCVSVQVAGSGWA